MTDREKVLEEALLYAARCLETLSDQSQFDGPEDARAYALSHSKVVRAALAPPGPASEPEREHDCDDDPDCQLCHHVNAPRPARTPMPPDRPCLRDGEEDCGHEPCCFDAPPEAQPAECWVHGRDYAKCGTLCTYKVPEVQPAPEGKPCPVCGSFDHERHHG